MPNETATIFDFVMTRLKVSLGGATCNGLKLVTSLTKEIKKSCENKIWHILQSNPIDLSRIERGYLQGAFMLPQQS